MAKRRMSYFEEQRSKFNDPNFYNGLSDEDLRRQIPRIIRDIRNDNISDQDLIYFKNDRIISACLYVSYDMYRKSSIIADALRYYNDNVLQFRNDINIRELRQYSANACNENTTRATLYYECWNVFNQIHLNPNCDINYIKIIVSYIKRLDQNMFRYI